MPDRQKSPVKHLILPIQGTDGPQPFLRRDVDLDVHCNAVMELLQDLFEGRHAQRFIDGTPLTDGKIEFPQFPERIESDLPFSGGVPVDHRIVLEDRHPVPGQTQIEFNHISSERQSFPHCQQRILGIESAGPPVGDANRTDSLQTLIQPGQGNTSHLHTPWFSGRWSKPGSAGKKKRSVRQPSARCLCLR